MLRGSGRKRELLAHSPTPAKWLTATVLLFVICLVVGRGDFWPLTAYPIYA